MIGLSTGQAIVNSAGNSREPDGVHRRGSHAHNPVSLKTTSHRLSYRVSRINSFVLDPAVSEHSVNDSERSERRVHPRAIIALAGLLWLEAAGLGGLAIVLATDLFTARPDSLAAALGLLAIMILAAVWFAVIAIRTVQGRAWIRGAVVTVAVLQIAVAIGAFQGLFARADIGWLLLAPAVAMLALVFSRSVVASTTERG